MTKTRGKGGREWLPENRRLRSQLVSVEYSSLQWHSMALSNNSASIFLSLTSLFPSPSPPPSFSKYYLHKSASSCPPFLSLFLSSNLHSIPLLSSLHSTPKYCNFSLVATTALQLRNDKFLACLPCLASLHSFPQPSSCCLHPLSASKRSVFPARLSSFTQLTRLTRLLPS